VVAYGKMAAAWNYLGYAGSELLRYQGRWGEKSRHTDLESKVGQSLQGHQVQLSIVTAYRYTYYCNKELYEQIPSKLTQSTVKAFGKRRKA
jgi:hypothetical protein